MKLRISSSILLSALTTFAFTSHAAVEPVVLVPSNKFYVGVFGGAGSTKDLDAKQFGTAFFLEAAGGPLAVNAFGQLNNKHASFYGIQLGYQAQEMFFNSFSEWAFVPAVELEGYIMSKRTFNGDLFNNTERLPEHDFVVSYPTKRNVFLVNAVAGLSHSCFPILPYIGLGIGSAIVRVSDASAIQVQPLEAGINHYNGSPNDATSTFAGQIKLGLSYDIIERVTIFAEYRWLYLASTHFVLGSTVYPTHAPTSSWDIQLAPQRYNLGNIGVRFNW